MLKALLGSYCMGTGVAIIMLSSNIARLLVGAGFVISGIVLFLLAGNKKTKKLEGKKDD